MKRYIKRFADIARAAGIVLLCLALVLTIYVTASINKPWSTFSGALRQAGVRTNFGTRVRFDGDYYAALSQAPTEAALGDAVRAEHARAHFAAYEAEALAAEAAAQADNTAAGWTWFDTEFDPQAFLEVHAQMENGAETRALSDIFEYIDGIAPAPAKGKAAKLKAASLAPWFEEAYAAFSAE